MTALTKCRDRWLYFALVALVIALGLASRRYAALMPNWLGKYPGDALWALIVFLILGALFRRGSTTWLALLALGVSFVVEFGQLYQPAWLMDVRSTTLGHLVLGSGFHLQDLVAYAAGVALGAIAEKVLIGARNG
ncbi:Protein of unknown function [Pseudoxanthomonas sp. GM95]|uniref:ribosomal maturation YjgA family protein n=1 Tax=Pseudoxanthomonas sp. GM95 TaxID=1881043 RepID=UPI0008D6F3E1|nr:DUF2809 domain-containing protein [Pseudoxanthomonas sp. GM95]SEL93732.1 Protein of unknown function [Pseudoxanthomonas sp. GM95]